MEQQAEILPQAPHGLPKGKSGEDDDSAMKAEVNLNEDGTVEEPINREPPMGNLLNSFLTDVDNYDRNHGPIQHRLAAEHIVKINGLELQELHLSAAQLENEFSQHKVTCALQCAGNRRHTMRTRVKEVQGVDWFDAAVMNCVWEGPLLRDILLKAGFAEDGESTSRKHVQFACYGAATQEDDWYGGSIPLARALDPGMEVILAVKMNGKPLSARHGFPVRSIVPGVLGARSVKWLDTITVSDEESGSFYQRHDYKILPPEAVDAKSAEQFWEKTPAMLDMPVNSCVAHPMAGSTVRPSPSGEIDLHGYAVPHGSDGPVTRVQVSGDEGRTWTDAKLDDGGPLASKWSWVLWNARIRIEKGTGKKIYAKATDRGGNTQDKEKSAWNLRGVAYNGYEAVYDLTVA